MSLQLPVRQPGDANRHEPARMATASSKLPKVPLCYNPSVFSELCCIRAVINSSLCYWCYTSNTGCGTHQWYRLSHPPWLAQSEKKEFRNKTLEPIKVWKQRDYATSLRIQRLQRPESLWELGKRPKTGETVKNCEKVRR